ncbi:MAG: FkbM family methyltransferase [bacterium]|nr:FkbM family methyltransferase [bacterium]
MKKINLFYWPISNLKTFSNFCQIYFAKIIKKIPNFLKTWDGAKFKVINLNSNLGTISEIWHEKAYGDLSGIKHIKNPIVIDIGANIGAFSVFACHRLNNPYIYAFEPEISNFRLLEHNIALNNLQNQIDANKKAVCAVVGSRVLNVTDEGSGNNSFHMDQPCKKTENVLCTNLSEIFEKKNINVCNLLKIDCEGSEYEIILNAPDALFRKIENIIIEIHPVRGYSPEELKSFLTARGYILEISKGNGSVLIASRNNVIS